MAERAQLEALFLANLGWIDRALASLARRHSLAGDAADDAASWVKLKLVEDNYAIIGKYRGESSITTYLTVVLAMLFRDYRVQCWGRWRPSAAARRMGTVAVRIETLVYRDRLTLTHVAHLLRTSGETTLGDRELSLILAALPERAPLRPTVVSESAMEEVLSPATADDIVLSDEHQLEQSEIRIAIENALSALDAEDRLIVQMRFWEGLSVAEIARGLVVEQKPLYRRLDRALATVRERLEQSGLSRDRTLELFAGEAS